MKTVRLYAKWAPRPDFRLGSKDIEGKLTYLGSRVWRNPQIRVEEQKLPEVDDNEVLVKVKACGICGSDVHMYQTDEEGYIFYPGLTAFPATLGHEFSGVVTKAGKNAINRRTNKRFEEGEAVCAEEMAWCGHCRPCADGFPNHCENLQEIGFSIDGAYAEYIKVEAKYCWSLEGLRDVYDEEKVFIAGSTVEPTSVAYNATIERGGGVRAGDNVLILGGGPIGVAACAVLRRAGASRVILSEPSAERRGLGQKLGATHLIDPSKENVTEKTLELTGGMGVNLILEATGLPDVVWKDVERIIWDGRTINTTVVIVARADKKIPLTGEVLQVRRARVVGSQGHSGHGTFPRVISAMASGMDMTPMMTKAIGFDDVEENLRMLQTNRAECKVTVFPES